MKNFSQILTAFLLSFSMVLILTPEPAEADRGRRKVRRERRQMRRQNKVDRRQNRQGQRIQNGVDNGQLTKKEAERLERGQERIRQAEEAAMANDGKIGRKEMRKLNRMQNRQNRRIRRKKHNRRRAGGDGAPAEDVSAE